MVSRKTEPRRDLGPALGLGPLDQIAFAVADLDAVLPSYQAMFGEFTVVTATFTPEEVTFRGEPASASLIVALGRSGEIEIELIQVVDGNAPTLEHLRRHGDGLHHIRFPVTDLTERVYALERSGCQTVLYGHRSGGLRFAYLEAPAAFGHTLFELIEFPPGDSRQSGVTTAEPPAA